LFSVNKATIFFHFRNFFTEKYGKWKTGKEPDFPENENGKYPSLVLTQNKLKNQQEQIQMMKNVATLKK
jgi:hypothetical protein